jgi:hypothetical protein
LPIREFPYPPVGSAFARLFSRARAASNPASSLPRPPDRKPSRRRSLDRGGYGESARSLQPLQCGGYGSSRRSCRTFFGPAVVRFAKTLGSKLQRRYDALPHVVGKSFAIELADFHAPGPMVWSREALFGYLCGMRPEVVEGDCVVRQSEPMVRIHRAPPRSP